MQTVRVPRGVFVGLATIDLVYEVDAFARANEKIAARSQQVYVGGPATNAAIAFRHLGGEAALATAVGCNPLAGVIHSELQQFGVRLADLHAEFDDVPAISSISVDQLGQRSVVSANAARIGALHPEADRELCAWADVLEVDGHQMQACQQWAQAARAAAKPVVLDGGSWKPGTDALLEHVHTAICSADFLPPNCKNEDDTVAYLLSRGVQQIAITHGGGPVRYVQISSGQPCAGELTPPCVEAVDTTGAGDIFHGAYCFFAAQGHGFVASLNEAAQIASAACRTRGTRAWMQG
jgi:sugar/nucleoside kinase (ribokinase family)